LLCDRKKAGQKDLRFAAFSGPVANASTEASFSWLRLWGQSRREEAGSGRPGDVWSARLAERDCLAVLGLKFVYCLDGEKCSLYLYK
jgi:hypothetical protein